MAQLININSTEFRRCNLSAIQSGGSWASLVPDTDEIILISTTNTLTAGGSGECDAYIMGDGETAASSLSLYNIGDAGDAGEIEDLIKNYLIILRKENIKNWVFGSSSTGTTDFPLSAGTTYELIWEESATIYFKWWDSENTQNTPISNRAVTGPYIYEFTPSVDVIKWNIYSSATNTFILRTKNPQRIVLLKDDIVNNLSEGGSDKILSAEQGRKLNGYISILNEYSIPLSEGTITNKGYASDSFTQAKAVFKNTGFKTLRIKEGYQYKLYGADVALYNNTSFTSLVGTFTSEPYVNTSSLAYFWILVKKEDDSRINIEDFFNIVTLEDESSSLTFKNENDVKDYYKFGTQFLISGYDVIDGEGWDINGSKATSSGYTRTDYIDVRNIAAIKMYCSTTYDDSRYCSRIFCKWFDEEYNAVGFSKYLGVRKDSMVIIGVPKHAAYVSIHKLQSSAHAFKLYGFRTENSVDSSYYGKSRSAIAGLARVSLILVYGQSLSTGSDAVAITLSQKYVAPKKIVTENNLYSFVPQQAVNTSASEYPGYGLGEMFVEAVAKENNISVYANEWERHFIVIAHCGSGQKNITQLKDGTLYNNIEAAITNTKNLCDEFGYTMDVPAWVWFQGEQDMKAQPNDGVAAISTPNEYKEALLALHEKICASITTITGSTKRPKCAIYQPASQCLYTQTYNFANSYLAFNNAYVDLLKNNDEFLAVAPVYIFDPSPNNAGFIHLSARSYKLLGAYAGYAIKRSLIDGVKLAGVIPTDISVSGTTIYIKYNVPCPPLKFDTEWVKETPLVNGVHTYGFNVVKSDNTELISSVSVFDDTVTIECSESPIGAKLRYGLNGDVYHYTNSNYNGADGRIHGGRGNLRDSQGDYVQKEIKEYNQIMRLDNWAYCFEQLLSE